MFPASLWLGTSQHWVGVSRLLGGGGDVVRARVFAGRRELLPLWHKSSSATGKEGREKLG